MSARIIAYLAIVSTSVLLASCQHADQNSAQLSASANQQTEPPVFAQALCAGCHGIKPLIRSPDPQAPSFPDIVNREGVNHDSLRRFLSDAHNYPEAMDFDLEPHHIDELSKYMITLKSPYHRRIP